MAFKKWKILFLKHHSKNQKFLCEIVKIEPKTPQAPTETNVVKLSQETEGAPTKINALKLSFVGVKSTPQINSLDDISSVELKILKLSEYQQELLNDINLKKSDAEKGGEKPGDRLEQIKIMKTYIHPLANFLKTNYQYKQESQVRLRRV